MVVTLGQQHNDGEKPTVRYTVHIHFVFLLHFFPSPPIRSGEVFSSVIFFPLFLFFCLCFFGCSDGMEREACVCDHGFERSDLCAEIIIIIITLIATQGH